MKVLHVVPSYLPATRYGGPVVSVHALCKQMAGLGVHVEVFTTDADGPDSLDVPLKQPVPMNGVSVSYFPRSFPKRLYRAPSLKSALRERVAEFDWVHLHSLYLYPTMVAAREAERAGVPWVVSPRGMLVPELVEERGTMRKRAWIKTFEQRTLEKAAWIHATTDLEVQQAKQFPFRWPSFHVIANGTEIPAQLLESDVLPKSWKAHFGHSPVILFLGRMTWKKRPEVLVDALANIPEAQLLFAGPDDEDLTKGLQKRAQENGVGDRTHFLGAVHGKYKSALLSCADILALPSLSENFGNVVVEALAHSTPVLCTPGVGTSTSIEACKAGIVTTDNPGSEEIAQHLNKFFNRLPGERERMGERGRQYVKSHFGWASVARSMLQAYENPPLAPGARRRSRPSKSAA